MHLLPVKMAHPAPLIVSGQQSGQRRCLICGLGVARVHTPEMFSDCRKRYMPKRRENSGTEQVLGKLAEPARHGNNIHANYGYVCGCVRFLARGRRYLNQFLNKCLGLVNLPAIRTHNLPWAKA